MEHRAAIKAMKVGPRRKNRRQKKNMVLSFESEGKDDGDAIYYCFAGHAFQAEL